MIRWGAYYMLIAVWLIIPLAWLLFRLRRRKERQLERLIHPNVIPILAPTYNRLRTRTRNIFWLFAFLFALIALARPQWGFHWDEVRRRGLDIMIALDTSKSMLAEDIKPNRLQQAKWGIRDLLQKLHGDRVGLVTFAGSAFLQCPLSMDYAAFLMSLDDVYAGIIPRGGTAIGKAVEKAVESFEYDKSNADKVLILVTDGEDHEGDTARLIPECKKHGIRVFAVGVGTIEGDLIPLKDEQGHSGFVKDAEGKVIKSSLNESPLQQLAMDTGGIYVRSAPGDFGMERIYDRGIDQLQRDEQESRMMKIYEERFVWFLLSAFIMLTIEALFSLQKKNGTSKRTSAGLAAILVFLGSSVVSKAGDSPRSLMNDGIRSYRSAEQLEQSLAGKKTEDIQQDETVKKAVLQAVGAYTVASSNFLQAAERARTEKKLSPAEAFCNAGNAYFRLQDYGNAESAWKSALQSQDLNLQGQLYYNLGVLSTAMLMTNQAPTFESIMSALDQSMSYYEKAILLAPNNPDAAVNYELTLRNKEALLAAREHILMLMAQAKHLVRQGRSEEALGLLQQFQQNPNSRQALNLDTSSQKDSTDLSSKISDILGVEEESRKILDDIRHQAQPDHSAEQNNENK